VVEILKQPQYDPMPAEQQIMVIFAVTNGFLDDLPPEDARRFERELLEFLSARKPEIGKKIEESGELPDEVVKELEAAIKEFRSTFQPSQGQAPHEAEAEALTDEEQERLKRFRRPTAEEYQRKAGPPGAGGVQLPG
jgi:F-type H+-transporting ATPase subunit alpha